MDSFLPCKHFRKMRKIGAVVLCLVQFYDQRWLPATIAMHKRRFPKLVIFLDQSVDLSVGYSQSECSSILVPAFFYKSLNRLLLFFLVHIQFFPPDNVRPLSAT